MINMHRKSRKDITRKQGTILDREGFQVSISSQSENEGGNKHDAMKASDRLVISSYQTQIGKSFAR
jgi:hypothetical protein